jgi:hypothetical protein
VIDQGGCLVVDTIFCAVFPFILMILHAELDTLHVFRRVKWLNSASMCHLLFPSTRLVERARELFFALFRYHVYASVQ